MTPYFKNLFRIFSDPKLIANQFWRSDVILPITAWFNPRQKWLTKVIPNTWCDKTELIPRINFAVLVDFVESEKGLSQLDIDWEDELKNGYVSQEYVDSVIHTYTELKDVYNYIKYERPSLEKAHDESYPELNAQGSYYEIYAETNRLEKLIEDRDTWALTKIIEHRGVLWT